MIFLRFIWKKVAVNSIRKNEMDTEVWGRRKCRPPSCCVTTLLHDPTCGEAAGCYGWPRPVPGWRELVMPFDGVTSSAVEPNHSLKLEGMYSICKWVCLLTFLVFTNPERRFKSKKKEKSRNRSKLIRLFSLSPKHIRICPVLLHHVRIRK